MDGEKWTEENVKVLLSDKQQEATHLTVTTFSNNDRARVTVWKDKKRLVSLKMEVAEQDQLLEALGYTK